MNVEQALTETEAAEKDGRLSAGAVENIRVWLTKPAYAAYVDEVMAHIAERKWRQLDDVFWTVIPFGTGGRRGRMYPIGSNAINDRTIGESAQGLADYARREMSEAETLSCAIAYDTRHRSRHFAELCAEVMVAAGFQVHFLDGYRSTPELSFLVRQRRCSCGIMVTASHNPPSDNAVKVYWSNGGQVLPPHDQAIIDAVMNVGEIGRVDFQRAVEQGHVMLCGEEIDEAFMAAVQAQSFGGPRDIRILFSPLHGVGASAVCPLLKRAGFENVKLFGLHAEPSGDFPNVPGHVSNPENPRVFDAIIEHGRPSGADLILATDPDCDRMGCAAPLTLHPGAQWKTLNGNQLGVLLTDYVLDQRERAGRLSSEHYVVKTLVTTEMIRRIGDSHGVRTHGNLLVGFKWIGGAIDQHGPDQFVLGCEESHGYLAGQHARDKDGPVACLLMSELAARLKAEGKSVHERLDELFQRHGAHAERLLTFRMEGSEGMENMKKLMARFRASPPDQIGGIAVETVRDYLNSTMSHAGDTRPLDGPVGDMVILDLTKTGNSIAVRPSGTEPKVKFYLFAYTPAEQLSDLKRDKSRLSVRLDAFETDLRAFCARRDTAAG
ncbi:MAG: phospho-sugar mutase [Planctomycetota bacterium]